MRHFIVFYIITTKMGKGEGHLTISTLGGYISRKDTFNEVKNQNKTVGEITSVAFTNIIELNQDDFIAWNN